MNLFQGAANRGPRGHEGRHPARPHVCRDGEDLRIHVQNSLEICCLLEDFPWQQIQMYIAKSLLRVRYFCVYRYNCKEIQSMELEYGDIVEQTKNFYDKSIQVISYTFSADYVTFNNIIFSLTSILQQNPKNVRLSLSRHFCRLARKGVCHSRSSRRAQ
jgi:hypothetical protein